MGEGKRYPTIYDVAERANVSIGTVSKALNTPARVTEPTRRRVLDAVAELNFVPKAAATSRARKGVGRIGVFAPFSSFESFHQRLNGVLLATSTAASAIEVVVFDVESAAESARALAAQGVKVALFDMQADKGEAVAAEIGGTFCNVDVTDDASVAAGFEKARAAHGQERICVNCAGIAPAEKTVGKNGAHNLGLFQKTIMVNLVGTFNMIRLAAEAMAKNEPEATGERGVLISTASVAAYDGQIGQVAYSASKGGVVGMTLPIARDLARSGIRNMTIAPGIFGTPMLFGMPQEVQDALAASVPFPSRLGRPQDYAKLVQHIVENDMLNGEVIRLDGAIRMAPK